MTRPRPSLSASLRRHGFRGMLLPGEPLAPYTTWQMGGPAELLAVPLHRQDLILALEWAAERGIPWRVLGNGSNLLIRDEGVRGLVLRVRKVLDRMEVAEEGRLAVGAGASYPALARLAAARGLSGLEFAAGIPGTVGGAVVMNAGWHEHETGDVVERVDYLEADGRVRSYARQECGFGYRQSVFRRRRGVVLGATFALPADDPARVEAALAAYAAARKQSQPVDQATCGSVYFKPPGDFAGRLIEAAGLKGLQVGGLRVSAKHANFLVNLGHGRARDAILLMERIETAVRERFGVNLVREVEIWE
ncbi:MAG: UDP-N-acetylmuramate dehydrogenase [Acidobacteriota bacterium]